MILITGAARSGTSLTAQIVQACGGNGGGLNVLYENQAIREQVIKPYLKSIGADPLGQWPLPNLNKPLPPFPGLREEVERRIPGDEPKFYKGAKLCLIWPVVAEAFPDAKWIIVRRNAEDIVASCLRTSFMRAHEDDKGWRRWVQHHETRFAEMRNSGIKVVEVWPQKLIYEYVDEMAYAMDWLELDADREKIESCVNREEWHC